MNAASPGIAAVTGATGFLGPHVLAALAGRGWRLRILARRHPTLDHPGAAVEVVPGDLGDAGALARLVTGADAIIHLAGAIKARDRAAFMAANADGTARLAEAWHRAAPGAHMVLVSSMVAREPGLSAYAASKREGEARLAGIAGEGGRYSILRPAAVYGPGDRETLAVFRAARLPAQPLLNGPDARLCLIHAGDFAAAVAAVAASDPAGRTHELSDARRDGYSWTEIAEKAAGALARPLRPVHAPRALLRALALLGDAAAALGGRGGMLTTSKLREVMHMDWASSEGAQPARHVWSPRIGLDEGFRQTVAWYRDRRWL